MSPTGRPEGEYRSAQHEGGPSSPTGRPEGEYRSAQHEGAPVSAPGFAARAGVDAPSADAPAGEVLVETRDLELHFPVTRGVMMRRQVGVVRAVDGVNLSLRKGECFGIIGESGCGKTTTAKAILRLVKPTAGQILFRGRDVWQLDKADLADHRCRVQAVFQDPYGSLNPRMRVDRIVSEPITANRQVPGAQLRSRVVELLELVGLTAAQAHNYPHEFSGGQRQRIALARAIASDPELVVLDEPVSALDVSIRAQMMNLLKEIQDKLGLSYLIIAHDLAVINSMSDTVAVMYLGKVVELASNEELYGNLLHPYTQALFAAAMPSHPDEPQQRIELKGEVPSAIDPPSGCHFHPRCPHAMPRCAETAPPLVQALPGHWVACHLHPGARSGSDEPGPVQADHDRPAIRAT